MDSSGKVQREKSFKRFREHERLSRKNSRSNTPSQKSTRSLSSNEHSDTKVKTQTIFNFNNKSNDNKKENESCNGFQAISKYLDSMDSDFQKIKKDDTLNKRYAQSNKFHFNSLLKEFKQSTSFVQEGEKDAKIRPSQWQKHVNARLKIKDSKMYEHYGKAMLKNDHNFYNFYNSKYNTNKMEKDVLTNNLQNNKHQINENMLKGQVDFSTNRQQKELFKN